jgi:hypothetical protein
MKSTNAKKYILGLFQLIFVLTALSAAANAGTYTVTTVSDGIGIPGSLREAINQANSTPDATFIININIGAGGLKTITPNSALPAINPANATAVTIDGTTMPGYAGVPLLQLNGSFAGASANGLSILKGNVTVKGLIINNFSQYGILTTCSSGGCGQVNLNVYGCYIGTDSSGTLAAGNANGIRIQTSSTVAGITTNIGGTAANQRNIISGNDANGIVIDSPFTTQPINIVNNYIGTNAAGTAAVPNGTNGIYIIDTIPAGVIANPDLLIGGPNAVQRNVISGNTANGISFSYSTLDTYVKGNYIGTNAAGTADLGNGANGILTRGITNFYPFVVGGPAPGEGNTISGNNENGIKNENTSMEIQGNRIGTNAAGTAAVPNSQDGVNTSNTATTVGDSAPGTGNTISGNGDDGVEIETGGSAVVWGNRIGVNLSGTAALPNGGDGISISGSGLIGEASAGTKNIISGNTGNGILLQSPASDLEIKGNYIGTNSAGANLGNGVDGIRVFSTVDKVQIGNVNAGEGNTIAFNNGDGVGLVAGFGSTNPDTIMIRGNSIYSNSGLGIDLGPTNGVTPNDLNDVDTGPNGLQNYPVLQLASGSFINGSLNSTPNEYFTIDFYRVDSCDASGHGEGRYYLGSKSVQASSGGNVNFTAIGFSLAVGQNIVATATSDVALLKGSTSEFSQCLAVSPPPGELKLNSATYSVSESNASAAIIVTRNNGSNGTITVDYTTSNGTATAGEDYTATTGTLTFLNGETGKLLSIPITNDSKDEPDETLTITLSNPTGGAQLVSPSSAVVTISDNDNPPTVSVNDLSIVEGNENLTPFTFTVSLSEASGFATSVNWTTAGGTANPTTDFQTNSGTVNFAAGETSKQIAVQVLGETLVEINETFSVNLTAPTMATLGDGSGTGTILDDDNPGKFSFSLAPYTVGEASGSATVTVARISGDAGTATVDYTTTGGTATPFADFTPVSGTLVFLDGELQKTFTVPILEDQIAEQAESFSLVLSSPTGGATLGVAAAVVNILDNDSGSPLTISGSIKKPDATPLAGATVNLTGTQNATTTTDGNGDYSFSSLTPAGSYAVTPSAIGYTFTPINYQYANLAASVTNATFTATPAPSRALRVVGSDAVPGQPGTAVVEIVAQGDENTVGFSMAFDPAVLSNPIVTLLGDAVSGSLIVNDSQAANGKLGVIIALPAGQVFVAGTRQIATLTFDSAQTSLYSTPLDFGNVPVQKQVVNVNADPLPSSYTNGAITFAQGFEADVAPRPTGSMNGSVTVADFTQIGRFVAGLNTPDQANEFQRSDVAPRISKGNGLLTVSDYTQAGRYAAGLDPVQTAGGAVTASLSTPAPSLTGEAGSPESVARTIRVVDTQTSAGQQVFVPVRIDSQGDENSFGFSLTYDTSKLSSPVVTLGSDTSGATLIVNTTQNGKVGVLLGLPAGTSLSIGDRHLVTIRFDVLIGAAAGQTPLTFGDQPIAREVVDANVNVLTTGYTGGSVNILGPTAAAVTVGGRVTDAWGRGIANAVVSISDIDGSGRKTATGSFGLYQFDGIEVGRVYILTVRSNRHQFDPDTRVVMILDEIGNIDFTAAPPPGSVTEVPEEER